MIVPDVNLLVYAYAAHVPQHERARSWWEGLIRGGEGVGLAWAVSLAFLRLMTSPSVLVKPLRPREALDAVETWYRQPHILPLDPGPRHLAILGTLLDGAGVAGALTPDAHLAALAIEHGCELHSNDSDFGRFPGLRWTNPLR